MGFLPLFTNCCNAMKCFFFSSCIRKSPQCNCSILARISSLIRKWLQCNEIVLLPVSSNIRYVIVQYSQGILTLFANRCNAIKWLSSFMRSKMCDQLFFFVKSRTTIATFQVILSIMFFQKMVIQSEL